MTLIATLIVTLTVPLTVPLTVTLGLQVEVSKDMRNPKNFYAIKVCVRLDVCMRFGMIVRKLRS